MLGYMPMFQGMFTSGPQHSINMPMFGLTESCWENVRYTPMFQDYTLEFFPYIAMQPPMFGSRLKTLIQYLVHDPLHDYVTTRVCL